jgi:uncharacterized protein (DUF488 family)
MATSPTSTLSSKRSRRSDHAPSVNAAPTSQRTKLRANLNEAGIDYLHIRTLGTPADGRAAARAGRPEEMHRIFLEHLATRGAQEGLASLADLVAGQRRVAIMCFEALAEHCHRRLVAQALREIVDVDVVDLLPDIAVD